MASRSKSTRIFLRYSALSTVIEEGSQSALNRLEYCEAAHGRDLADWKAVRLVRSAVSEPCAEPWRGSAARRKTRAAGPGLCAGGLPSRRSLLCAPGPA